MPRRPPTASAVEAANTFVHVFIAEASDDHILPKNGRFSPFHGFSRMLSKYASVKDGGACVDGVSRAALNKMAGAYFQEAMRKPARNGNPGELDQGAAKLSRHFLRARWRDPDDAEDCMVLQQMFAVMGPQEVEHCVEVLRDFSRWRPGPAGRGGDRTVRTASEAGLSRDEAMRSVRRRIEAGMAAAERTALADSDDDGDDDMSMRSTVVCDSGARRPRAPATPCRASAPLAPVDKVVQLEGVIDHIRNRSLMSGAALGASPHGVSHGMAKGSAAAAAAAAAPDAGRSVTSADLLHSLFHMLGSQQAGLPPALPALPPAPRRPVAEAPALPVHGAGAAAVQPPGIHGPAMRAVRNGVGVGVGGGVEAAAEAPGVSAGSGRIAELVRGLQSHVHAGACAAPLSAASVAAPACRVGGLGGLCNSVGSVGGVGGVGLQGNQDGPGVRLPPLKAVLGKVVAIH